MRGWDWLILVSLVFCGVNAPVLASEEEWRVQRLNDRYDDFFARQQRERAYDEHRDAGAPEIAKEMAKWDEQMKQAREDFINHRPPPPNLDAHYHEWAEQQLKYSQQQEQAREEYLRMQIHIENLEKTAKKIPGNLEYDLDNRY